MWVLFGSFFMFSNFYILYLHNKNSGSISKYTMKRLQKPDEKSDLP